LTPSTVLEVKRTTWSSSLSGSSLPCPWSLGPLSQSSAAKRDRNIFWPIDYWPLPSACPQSSAAKRDINILWSTATGSCLLFRSSRSLLDYNCQRLWIDDTSLWSSPWHSSLGACAAPTDHFGFPHRELRSLSPGSVLGPALALDSLSNHPSVFVLGCSLCKSTCLRNSPLGLRPPVSRSCPLSATRQWILFDPPCPGPWLLALSVASLWELFSSDPDLVSRSCLLPLLSMQDPSTHFVPLLISYVLLEPSVVALILVNITESMLALAE
jgi:hypothetical protein